MNKINQHQRAYIAWESLTQIAKERSLIRYGHLGKQIGIHHRPVRYVLGLIQDYCLHNQLPPLTILVINQSGLPGEGFIAWDVDNIDEGLKQVYNYNWEILDNPFSFAKHGHTEDEIVKELLENPDKSKETYAIVKVRGAAQSIFRKALLEIYDYECAFCGFSFEVGLQASHIIPWSISKRSERLDVRNGILLCSIHHDLFDNRWMTINNDYSINCDDVDEKEGVYSKYDSLLATALHGKKMTLPIDRKHWPKIGFIESHRKGFK